MFIEFGNETRKEISVGEVNAEKLTAGYIGVDELKTVYEKFGLTANTVESCSAKAEYFRSGVEVYDSFTFTELRITSTGQLNDDCVSLYIKKNLFLVIDVADNDGSIKQRFVTACGRYPCGAVTLEKLIYAFFDAILSGDVKILEETGTKLSDIEEQLISNKVDDGFVANLLEIKKELLRRHNYYEQILDITDELEDNENDIFDSDNLMYINNLSKKVDRLREDTDSLKNTVEHIQSAYSSYLDMNLNSTMKTLTVLTSIFFPLTIIVGWYGMNFKYTPEFEWRYGYIYVILLSVLTVIALVLLGKKKKWF